MAGRIILWLLVLGAIVFALHGGEYSTLDLWRQRQTKVRLTREVDSLERRVDSLRREARAVSSDPRAQEKIAREQYGMVRGDKEILYRLGEPADTTPGR